MGKVTEEYHDPNCANSGRKRAVEFQNLLRYYNWSTIGGMNEHMRNHVSFVRCGDLTSVRRDE